MQISPNKNINLTSNQKYQPTFFNVKPMETKISDQQNRSLSIKLWGFRSQEKTTRTILMIFGARKTGDHACSRESKIIQIVRLRKN